ncbi:MAG: signal peptidase II [Chloroflexi bacterium]|nr:signal peptidase II [Chloroflexota bacterium]MBI3040541.1 signal peptidase II [Chloroflexota bacterium]MBI3930569.1 signal peptidase II [Chloroflexota bacterium]
MKRAEPLQAKWWNVVFFLTALLVVVADQFSKIGIRSYPVGYTVFEVGFFRIMRVPPNTGAAFGSFQGQSFALTIVALVGIITILAYTLFFSRWFPSLESRLGKSALGLVLGGITGNLIDRLNPSLGGVTDFINISIWPTFNIADSAITVGLILFAYSLRFLSRAKNLDLAD